jgi:HAD superfamily phosphatase (TIGR01668 family)
MIEKFRPNKYYTNVFSVDFNKLKNQGIKVVACDLDNTLVPHDIKEANEEVQELINKVKSLGMDFVIISNNHEKRVSNFAGGLDIQYYYDARKPLPKVMKKILSKYHIKKNELALIGDQIMTDVFGANSFGITSILVTPLAKRDIIWTKPNRFMEARIIKRLDKLNLFKIGRYYD